MTKSTLGSYMSFWLRRVLYSALVLSAAMTLLSRTYILPSVRDGAVSPIWVLVFPAVFAALFIIFVADEIALARSGRPKRLLSIVPYAFGAVLLTLLLPTHIQEYRARKAAPIQSVGFYDDLFGSRDARTRALVMTAATCAALPASQWYRLMDKGLSDGDPLVRQAAKRSVGDRTGNRFAEGALGVDHAKKVLKSWHESIFVAKKNIQ